MTTISSTTMAASSTETSNPNPSMTAPVNQTVLPTRVRIARWILIYHFALIVISAVFYLLRGFDREEFTALMGMLTPITALYGGAVFRFLGKSITETSSPVAFNDPDISGLVKWIVHGHFIVILGLISMKALFNFINFEDMTMFFTFIETGVGAYMGSVLLALFEGKANGK